MEENGIILREVIELECCRVLGVLSKKKKLNK